MWQRLMESACILALLLSGVVHGLWTHRWQPASHLLAEAATRLEQVPPIIGTWHGTDRVLDPAEIAKAGAAAVFSRSYESDDRLARVEVLLVCGYPGPVSVHPPEACLRGTGYTLTGGPARYTAPGLGAEQPPEFWMAGFARGSSLVPVHRSVYWAWSATGAWQAPDNPRLAFASAPILYKLYVTCESVPADEGQENNVCREFLTELLPALQKALFDDARSDQPGAGADSSDVSLVFDRSVEK